MKVIQIEITNACPKRCSNCTRFCGHHTKPSFMDFETFKQAVDSMKGFKGVVGIMGGEPTIHPEFDKFVRYYRDNIGYDDFSTACYEPTSNFVNHILANAFDVDHSNQRGLWTSVNSKYYEHFEQIQDTFGFQLVNDHSNPSMHETLMVTRKELGIPDDEWVQLRDKCWIQNLWSASITPKGTFFCEVAASLDTLFNGPGGWKIEPGWWKRKPEDFTDQLHWCELCSAALPMPKRDANEETDDVSPVWYEKLAQIESPKLKKGLVQQFDPKSYKAEDHAVICDDCNPYMQDQSQRIGSARKVLLPQQVCSVAWFTDKFSSDDAQRTVKALQAAGRLDLILSAKPEHRQVAEAAGVCFVDAAGRKGTELLGEIRNGGNVRDWVLLMRDGEPSESTLKLLQSCVFNPGCVYSEGGGSRGSSWFFNLRASSLANGGDPLNIAASYPKRKVVKFRGRDASHYELGNAGTFYRRIVKRLCWSKKRLGLKLGVNRCS